MNLKFSLKWLLAGTAIAAVSAAALVNASEAWSQVMFAVSFVLLLSSILAAIFTGRGFYAGFGLFGGAYWLLVVPPAWDNHFEQRLPTWPVSEYVYELVSRERPPESLEELAMSRLMTAQGAKGTITRPSSTHFRRVAHSYWVILVGLLGGVIGMYINAGGKRPTASA